MKRSKRDQNQVKQAKTSPKPIRTLDDRELEDVAGGGGGGGGNYLVPKGGGGGGNYI